MKQKLITLVAAFVMVCTMVAVGNTAPIYAEETATEEVACTHEKFHPQYQKKINATCTEYGKISGYCLYCFTPIEKVDPNSPPLEHEFTVKSLKDQYKKSDATCKTPKLYYYACSRSGCTAHGEETYEIGEPSKSHAPLESINCVKARCTTCQTLLIYKDKSHTWVAATCTTPKTCTSCGATEGGIVHQWKDATCTEPKTCTNCGAIDSTQPAKGHMWVKKSCTKQECGRCHAVEAISDHRWKAGDCATLTTCEVCKATTGELLPHTIEIIPAEPSTCIKVGLSAGEKCSVCKEVLKAQIPQGTAPHTALYETYMPATKQTDGKEYKVCAVCYYPFDEVKISRIGKVEMAETVVYTGKAQKPKVKVYDQKGKLISSQYYTVTYKNNKAIGNATANIKFKDRYFGTVTKQFQVVPKSTSLTKLVKGKKAITVKWKKGKKAQVNGYEILVGTSKLFLGNSKTYTAKGWNKTSFKVTKLLAKKKYYVKIRTYKTVKIIGRDVKIYSGWSNVKTIKTK